MELKSLLKEHEVIDVPYFDEDMEGFIVKMSYISRDTVKDLIKDATDISYNKKTRKPEEKLNEDKFQELYVNTAVLGWEGLKFKYLADLVLIDTDQVGDEDEEFPYSPKAAYELVANSTAFDEFVTTVMRDFNFFSKSSSKKTRSE